MEHSTIAAIATAPGAGGIAVVRLSGPESYAVAAKVFHPANPAKRVEDAKGYTALFGHFMEGEEAFDEGVALFFRAPHSYTGDSTFVSAWRMSAAETHWEMAEASATPTTFNWQTMTKNRLSRMFSTPAVLK